MKYAAIKTVDIANGTGVRVSLFVSGCTHHCPDCFNEIAWDFQYGEDFTQDTIDDLIELMRQPHIQGLSLLGGEPMEPTNQEGLLPLLQKCIRNFLPKMFGVILAMI
ncbi:MAG: 4Fe-4S cluster-binding domain-containing protein [Massilimicrobiota timonensis]